VEQNRTKRRDERRERREEIWGVEGIKLKSREANVEKLLFRQLETVNNKSVAKL